VVPAAGFELGRRAVRDHAPGADHDGPRADRVDLLEDVRREHDDLLVRHLADQRADLVLLVGVEPVGGLVHDQHRRVVQDGLRQADAPLVALAERLDALVHHAAQVHGLRRGLDAPPRLRAVEAAHARHEGQEAVRRHVGIAGRALRQVADLALGLARPARDVVAADRDAARGRHEEARDHLHGRRLARAVGPEEAEHLAAAHREAHVVDGREGAEALGEVADLDRGRHGGSRKAAPTSGFLYRWAAAGQDPPDGSSVCSAIQAR
jgi:hypothetical protein